MTTADSKRQRAYNSKPSSVAARVRRNQARAKALKAGTVKKGDSKEVHHTKANAKGKTRVTSRTENRKIGKPGK
jgi:hypothetical protein